MNEVRDLHLMMVRLGLAGALVFPACAGQIEGIILDPSTNPVVARVTLYDHNEYWVNSTVAEPMGRMCSVGWRRGTIVFSVP